MNLNISEPRNIKEKGVALITFVAIIMLILIIAFTSIYFIFYHEKDAKVDEFQPGGAQAISERKEKIKQLGMDTRIVNDITEEEVPIPNGFSYIQGNKNTGVIIKSNKTEIQYLFIPYNSNIQELPNEYYKKVNYISMDLMTLNSIKKYNGFFVELNANYKIEDLKTINKSNYESLYKQLQYIVEDDKTAKAHMLYKEEIAQINNYLNSNSINLGDNTIGIQAFVVEPFSKINPEELTVNNTNINTSKAIDDQAQTIQLAKTNNLKIDTVASKKNTSEYVYMLKTSSEFYGGSDKKKVEIPIPNGFDYCEIDGIIMIRDIDNENLVYIWVPINYKSKDAIKNDLWNEIYSKEVDGKTISKDTEIYDKIKNSEEKIDSDFEESIKEFKGFYISQAELSEQEEIDSSEYMNISRGMVNYSVSGTVGGGDYVRGSNLKSKIYNKMKNISEECNEHKSVVGHLTYGLEWDATLLWIAQTNGDYTDKDGNDIYSILSTKSKNVGKYTDSNLSATSSASEVKSFNGIWGLGGNLAEVTQETYDGEYVTRGGSYSDTGEHAPIASRNAVEDLNQQNIGFRTCLYINPEAKITKTENDTFEYNPSDDIIEKIDDMDFKLMGNVSRFVNDWNGINVYETPSEKANIIEHFSMGQEVEVYAKAVEEITSDDGTKLVWAKIKLSDKNNNYGYVNAQHLTDTITYFSDGNNNSVGFVMTGEKVVRYYKEGFTVYSDPNDNNMLFSTAYSGQLEIIGKSINQEWALYQVGEKQRFVHSKDLTADVEREKSENDIEFIKGNEKKFFAIENGVKLYPQPSESNEISTLYYGKEAIVTAISTDGIWFKATVDSISGYILNNKLTTIEPSAEKKAERGGNFTVVNDVVYVNATDVNVRTSCDTTDNSNIITTVTYRDSVNRIAHGDNGWDKVSINGQTAYIYNKYLSTTQPAVIENAAKTEQTGSGSSAGGSGSSTGGSSR